MNKYLIFLIYIVMAFWSVTVQAQLKIRTKKVSASTKDSTVSTQQPQKNSEELDSALAVLARKQDEIKELTKSLAYVQNKATSLENELKDCEKKLSADCPPCATPGAIPWTGTVYKIQLGVFKNPDINDNLTKQKYMGIEKIDGQYRYVLSYFEDYEECMKFINELKRLGIQGASAVRYEDGERVGSDLPPEPEPTPTPVVKPKPEPATPATKPAPKPATRPAAKPGAKPGTKPVTKPATKPSTEKRSL